MNPTARFNTVIRNINFRRTRAKYLNASRPNHTFLTHSTRRACVLLTIQEHEARRLAKEEQDAREAAEFSAMFANDEHHDGE